MGDVVGGARLGVRQMQVREGDDTRGTAAMGKQASVRVAEVLRSLEGLSATRRRVLTAIAEGELRLGADDRAAIVRAEGEIARMLRIIGEASGVTVVQRVTVEDASEMLKRREAEGFRLPEGLRVQYELLADRAVGSQASISIGDSSVIRGIGKADSRTSSDKTMHRPGARTSSKKAGMNTRAVLKDQAAVDFKRSIDKRLRGVGRDIRAWLAGEQLETVAVSCDRCGQLGERTWRYCPSCGGTMSA